MGDLFGGQHSKDTHVLFGSQQANAGTTVNPSPSKTKSGGNGGMPVMPPKVRKPNLGLKSRNPKKSLPGQTGLPTQSESNPLETQPLIYNNTQQPGSGLIPDSNPSLPDGGSREILSKVDMTNPAQLPPKPSKTEKVPTSKSSHGGMPMMPPKGGARPQPRKNLSPIGSGGGMPSLPPTGGKPPVRKTMPGLPGSGKCMLPPKIGGSGMSNSGLARTRAMAMTGASNVLTGKALPAVNPTGSTNPNQGQPTQPPRSTILFQGTTVGPGAMFTQPQSNAGVTNTSNLFNQPSTGQNQE